MAPPSLLESVRAAFGPEFVRRAAAYLGDPEVAVRKSLEAVIPVTLAGMVNKAEAAGADSISALAIDAVQEPRSVSLSEHFTTGTEAVPAEAHNLIRGLFGDRFGSITNAVASFTGDRGSSVTALFGSVVPYALSLLGRDIRENNFSPTSVSTLLASQKASIWSAVPTGLNLTGLLGPPSRPSPSYVAAGAAPVQRGNPWLLPVLVLLVAGGVAWWLMRSRGPDPVVSAGLDTAPRAAPAPVHGAPIKVSLPNGMILDVREGGIEERLVTFLNDPAAQPGENVWFDFHDLNFESGTARIVPESRGEVNNIVKILKAFPAVRIKIGGYTDSVGIPAANLKLSQERADAVVNGQHP